MRGSSKHEHLNFKPGLVPNEEEVNMGSKSMSASQETNWVRDLARFGYGAKGIVYAVVGILAIQGVARSGQEGALSTISQQPFGQVLLGVVGLGLLAYALWRFVQAGLDPENEGDDAEGSAKRIAYASSGVVYLGLAISAAQIVIGSGGGGGGGAQGWTARLLSVPFGQWLVGLVGASVIAGGLYQLKQAATADFKEDFDLREMSSEEETWAERAGRLGHAARTIVYFIIGWFLIQAALTSNAQQAGGLGKALDTLQNQPYGPWLLTAAGAGLICYGIYCFVMARYRKAVM